MSFSVSSIRNWFLKDPLLDYLNLYGNPDDKDTFSFPECNFTQYIMNKGNQYEQQIYDYININRGDYTMTIIDRKNFYDQTCYAFQNKVDIICQPFVKDYTNQLFKKYKVFGFPDLVIKKKVFIKLFHLPSTFQLQDCDDETYIVIDIKYSSFKTQIYNDVNNHFFQSKSLYDKFVECQIILYAHLVNLFCKQSVKYAYICPKQKVYSNQPLQLLQINVSHFTYYSKDCEMAFHWMTFLKTQGNNINLNLVMTSHQPKTISFTELFPNLNNTYDYPWSQYKLKLAKQVGEISLFSGIGEVLRTELFHQRKYSYKHINHLDHINELTQVLLEGYDQDCFIPQRSKDLSNRLYIDIETCYLFEEEREMIVMICIGYVKEGRWITHIIVDNKEDILIQEFIEFMRCFKEYVIVHYSSAEYKLLKKIEAIMMSDDLYKKFKQMYKAKEIILKGLTGYSIKEIMKALYENHLIDENPYDRCKIKNGIEVLSIYNQMFEQYKSSEGINMIQTIYSKDSICNILDSSRTRSVLKDDKILKYKEMIDAIKEYNEMDVKSLYLLDQFITI